MSKPSIDFYFDFISPFGYFAALRIDDMAARHGRSVVWHSILLGIAVVKVMGLKPLLETPLKGDYLRADLARYARRHGLELVLPPGPDLIDPLPPARAFQWIKARDAEGAKAMALDLLTAYWGRGVDVARWEVIGETAERHGFDGETVVAGANGPEARALLRNEVETAIGRGVFGSPFLLIDGAPFWGVDKLELAEEWLREGGW